MTAARPLDRQRAVMSRLTLAALEDSGWYQPDYSQAADLEWGAGAGCTFLLGSCQQFAAENPRQDLFCPQGSANTVRCSAGARLWGVCRASSFTDGCLIVGRDAPKDSGPGGAASDFSGNFDCLPPYALDAATKALLPRIGASGMARDDRCFDLVAPPQAAKGAKTLCVAGGGGGAAQCASERALCFRAACDAKGALSVVIQGAGGAPATKLACPTGTTLNLAAKATGRFSSGALRCPDNARTCRGLACGACDPAGGFCSLQSGRCNCWVERTGPSCGVAVAAAKQSAG
ncbi:zinc-metallopeptidase-like protein [Monoraphidium neglectum]|uniref:Zinc-metallopeptidase-like protein n=1 Tax=Monoraphidium neglectum TaxID=145388 RepID=A0A0D2MBV7_9CHLO|nr:zinc-metallopeptidase-like protein [Monoraphidium neglectum]KIY92810.1 zinc-metallopeptidase-like protein [Monoraphidium neglectum]|eukprot:XP_013891830.1 zinc-metallopeptidase-like protein [Monoraphidium neglectum]